MSSSDAQLEETLTRHNRAHSASVDIKQHDPALFDHPAQHVQGQNSHRKQDQNDAVSWVDDISHEAVNGEDGASRRDSDPSHAPVIHPPTQGQICRYVEALRISVPIILRVP